MAETTLDPVLEKLFYSKKMEQRIISWLNEMHHFEYMIDVYSCMAIFGVAGNVTICFVILCNKSMHTITNCYLFNLAISDLMLLIWAFPTNTLVIQTSRFLCILRYGFILYINLDQLIFTYSIIIIIIIIIIVEVRYWRLQFILL